MTIDWINFTPGSALLGGAMIGLAAALLVMLTGRVMGISSMVGKLLGGAEGEAAWSISFIAGLVMAPIVLLLWQPAGNLPPATGLSLPILAAGGLLVGFGTRLGSGCTSGHGVCGLARLSPRSLVATLCFVASGALTVYMVRHVINSAGAA